MIFTDVDLVGQLGDVIVVEGFTCPDEGFKFAHGQLPLCYDAL